MTLATPRELGFRWPAEWEPQRATWLAWPHNSEDWPGKFAGIEWVFCEIISWLTRSERVGLIVADAAAEGAARHALELVGVDCGRIDFLVAPTNRSWTRDFVPTWLLPGAPRASGAGAAQGLGAVKWQFNGWARYPNFELDEVAGQRVAEAGQDAKVLVAECDLGLIEQARRGWPFLRDRRIDAYAGLERRFGAGPK